MEIIKTVGKWVLWAAIIWFSFRLLIGYNSERSFFQNVGTTFGVFKEDVATHVIGK